MKEPVKKTEKVLHLNKYAEAIPIDDLGEYIIETTNSL